MLKNYYQIDEESTVTSFLKGIKEKKNVSYIILDTEPKHFVDIRTIALKLHNSDEKLKNLKKPLSKSSGDNLRRFVESGDRVIETNTNYYDFIDALNEVLENNHNILKDKVDNHSKKEIFALNSSDKISTARNLFIKNRINLLPIIEGRDIVGELRPIDFIGAIFHKDSGNMDLYSEKKSDSRQNTEVTNIMNVKPHTISKNSTIREAVELMVNKKLPSVIVTDNDRLYSIISHKDILRKVVVENETNYNIEVVGGKELYEDEIDLVFDYAEKSMKKISKISDYTDLKVTFKSHGNTEGTHMKKVTINLLLSHGKKVITVSKEIVQGTSHEEANDKVKGKWNIPQVAQSALKALETKVLSEKKRKK